MGIIFSQILASAPPAQFDVPWCWCSRCERAYKRSVRVIRFAPDAIHRHTSRMTTCDYADCGGGGQRVEWPWATCRAWHPSYPAIPERGVVYPA